MYSAYICIQKKKFNFSLAAILYGVIHQPDQASYTNPLLIQAGSVFICIFAHWCMTSIHFVNFRKFEEPRCLMGQFIGPPPPRRGVARFVLSQSASRLLQSQQNISLERVCWRFRSQLISKLSHEVTAERISVKMKSKSLVFSMSLADFTSICPVGMEKFRFCHTRNFSCSNGPAPARSR